MKSITKLMTIIRKYKMKYGVKLMLTLILVFGYINLNAQINFFKEEFEFDKPQTWNYYLKVKNMKDMEKVNEQFKVTLRIVDSEHRKEMTRQNELDSIAIDLKEVKRKLDSAKTDTPANQVKIDLIEDIYDSTKKHHEQVSIEVEKLDTNYKENFKYIFFLDELNTEIFEKKFLAGMEKLSLGKEYDDIIKKDVQLLAGRYFIKILSKYNTIDKETPRSGVMYVNKVVDVYEEENRYRPIKKESEYKKVLTIKTVQMEIADGLIVKISVQGKLEGDHYATTFHSLFPVKFSSIYDFSRLNMARMYNADYKVRDTILRLDLGDVITYTPILGLRAYDYAPANGVYNILHKDNESVQERVFYKEKTSAILDVKIYSDFTGLEEDNPNGLVQTEFSKKIHFNPTYGYFGEVSFVEPKLVISKFDEKLRAFELTPFSIITVDSVNSDTTITTKYFASGLDIFRYSNVNIGVKLNALNGFIPRFKTLLEINVGASLYNTVFEIPSVTLLDSSGAETILKESEKFNEYSYILDAELVWQLRLDSRWGVDFLIKFMNQKLVGDQLRMSKDATNAESHVWLFSPQIMGYFKPDLKKDNVIYFRAAYYNDTQNTDDFMKMQVGYSHKLVKDKSK